MDVQIEEKVHGKKQCHTIRSYILARIIAMGPLSIANRFVIV